MLQHSTGWIFLVYDCSYLASQLVSKQVVKNEEFANCETKCEIGIWEVNYVCRCVFFSSLNVIIASQENCIYFAKKALHLLI